MDDPKQAPSIVRDCEPPSLAGLQANFK